MTDDDKKDFALMMRVTWQSYGRNPPDKETMKFWFEKLAEHSVKVVGNAFDKWIITNADDLPSFKNIADLCKPNPTIFARLPSPLAQADNKRHVDELVELLSQNVISKTDYRAWAHKIIANPKNYPDISLRIAKEAVNAKEAA
jgi:hypothetical protein